MRKWRNRWCAAPGVASLSDAKRSGRPAEFSPVRVAQAKAAAGAPPAESGLALSRWSWTSMSWLQIARRCGVDSDTVRQCFTRVDAEVDGAQQCGEGVDGPSALSDHLLAGDDQDTRNHPLAGCP